jgi:diguanylate cyclase (GGDEF)-like protein
MLPLDNQSDIASLNRRKRPVVAASIAFVLAVCLSLIFLQAWSTLIARKSHLHEGMIDTANMTRALSEHAENSIMLVDTVLLELTEQLDNGRGRDTPAARMHELMVKRIAQVPALHGLFWFDQHGRWVATSERKQSLSLTSKERPYFVFHQSNPSKNVRIGEPIRSQSTGDWIIPVSRRLNHADGSFAGVLLATIDSNYFQKFYNGFDTGRNGAIVFARDDGTVLLRKPSTPGVVGTSLWNGAIFRLYRENGPVGSGTLRAQVDNVERLYSYRHLERYPIIVATALSTEEVLENWVNVSYRFAAGIGILLVLLGALGTRMIRQILLHERLEDELQAAKLTLEERNAKLRTMAMSDGLTGIPNRRHFDEMLTREYGRAVRTGAPLALIMLDVDFFKKYNDIYGHPAGDACLIQVAQVVQRSHGRATDLVARYGGEEFVILLPDTDLSGATSVAEKVRAAVTQLGLPHAGNTTQFVSISAGVHAQRPVAAGGTPQALIQAADRALYSAKLTGRNRVCTSVESNADA